MSLCFATSRSMQHHVRVRAQLASAVSSNTIARSPRHLCRIGNAACTNASGTTRHAHPSRRLLSSSVTEKAAQQEVLRAREAQRKAYDHYRRKNEPSFPFNLFRGRGTQRASESSSSSLHDRNVKIASYAAAVVIGALGATYAAVPLYKVSFEHASNSGRHIPVEREDLQI